MLTFPEYTQFFIAMLAIVDPITILPLFLFLVRDFDKRQKRALARKAAFATTAALVTAVFIGQTLLDFFGISIGSFQVAGGLLLMILALQLLYQKDQQLLAADVQGATAGSEVVVPLAIPLLAGPGALSTVIVFTHRSETWQHNLVLSASLLLIGAIVWLALHLSSQLADRVNTMLLSVVNKIVGLILAAISVEFISSGIKSIFQL